jgi:hypothetical protein
MIEMRTLIGISLVIAVVGCSAGSNTVPPSDNLAAVLVQTNLSADARFEMVKNSVSEGTLMLKVVELLGTNYTIMRPISTVMSPPLKESDKRVSIIYEFSGLQFSVITTEPMLADPLVGRCTGIARVTRMTTIPLKELGQQKH